ncbi:MAG: hypothetical protein AB4290_06590 [Spirulina sp.]
MDSVDDLLAKMQSEFAEKHKAKEEKSRDRQKKSGEIERLLAELQGEFHNRSKTNETRSMSPKPQEPSTDDLLAQMQAEFGQPEKPPQKRETSAIDDLLSDVAGEFAEKTPQPPTPARSPQIDEMLAEVRGDFSKQKEEKRSRRPRVSASTDRFLSDLKADFQQKHRREIPPSQHHKATKIRDRQTDDLLADLKSEFNKEDIAERLRRQEKEMREKREREWQRQQRRKALKRKAEEWLKQLDPYSGEGLWFAEFAQHYPNKIEAAIDYLETVWETQK